jgi:hypothetical protein
MQWSSCNNKFKSIDTKYYVMSIEASSYLTM